MDFNNNDKIDDKTQDLNTYVDDICLDILPLATYKGLKVSCSKSALRELTKHEKNIEDILEILHKGYEAPRKRKRNTIEKWLNKGNKTYNVVIVQDYFRILNEKVWLVTHFGKFTRKLL